MRVTRLGFQPVENANEFDYEEEKDLEEDHSVFVLGPNAMFRNEGASVVRLNKINCPYAWIPGISLKFLRASTQEYSSTANVFEIMASMVPPPVVVRYALTVGKTNRLILLK